MPLVSSEYSEFYQNSISMCISKIVELTRTFNSNFHLNIVLLNSRHNAQVLVGTYRLSSGGTRYQVKTIIPHEKYNNGIDYSNNIAVIQVQGQIEFNETVQPIKLSKIPLREGDTVIATGWGLEDVRFSIFNYIISNQK